MQKTTYLLLSTLACSGLNATKATADHLSGGFDLGQSSAILTESAIPLEQGSWYFSLSTEVVDHKRFSDDKLIGLRAFDILEHGEAHSDLHSVEQISNTSLSFAYGITENLTLGLRLPYVERKNIREPEEGHAHSGPLILHDVIEHGDSKGMGDATLMGLYRFNQSDTASMALLFGIKLPTGATSENGFKDEVFVRRIDTGVVPHGHGDESGHSHSGTRLETHQQPGSGAYSPIFGLAYSRNVGLFDINSSIMYIFANDGSQSTNLGDSFKYNLGLSYSPRNYLQLVIELNGERQDSEIRAHEVIGNSGGSHLYLSPGIRFVSDRNWSGSLSYGIPLHEAIRGYQSEPDSRLSASFSVNF